MRERTHQRRILSVCKLSLILAVSFLCAFSVRGRVYADEPLKALSEKKFNSALSEMVAEYEKEGISEAEAARNPYVAERLILKSMDPNVDPEELGAVDAIKDRDGMYILQFDSVQDTKKAEEELEEQVGTVYVEPDSRVFAQESDTLYYSKQDGWGESAGMIGADVLGNALKGQNGSVTVAILDTGIYYTMKDLSGRIDRTNATSLVSGCSPNQSLEGRENLNSSSVHGTHVAGIVAQCTEAVAGKVKIMPVRVLDNDGGGYTSDVARGIRYAAQKGAKVINLSLGGSASSSNMMREAVSYATSLGSVVVVASGNENQSTMNCDPARIEECIVVGASINKTGRAYFSNYGPTLDLVAPGVSIFSTLYEDGGRDRYYRMSGTSMATPHASGAAALVRLAFPLAGPEETERILQMTATDLGAPGWDEYYGFGILNLSSVVSRRDSLLTQARIDVAQLKKNKAEEARRKAAEEAAKKKAAEEAAKKRAAEEAARKRAQEEAAKKKAAEEAARQRAEQEALATVRRGTKPHANADYVIPIQRGHTTNALRVAGLGPNDSVVSWAVSDPSIITVTGRADGSCVVSAGNKTGDAMISAVTASQIMVSFHVRVQKKKVSLKGVSVPTKKITLRVGQSFDLEAWPKPITVGKGLKYSSSKKSVATVSSNGVVTARRAGSAVITVKCGKKKVKVKVTVIAS